MSTDGDTPVIDADVHILTRSGWEDLEPHVSSGWRERLAHFAPSLNRPCGPELDYHHPELVLVAGDAEKGRAGSDPQTTIAAVKEAGAEGGVLVPSESRSLAEILSPDDSVQLARAYNAYFAAQWADADPSFGLLALVSPQNPTEGGAEVDRHADRPEVVGVLLPLIDVLPGNRYYEPILAAAEAAGLPVVVQGGLTAPVDGTPYYAGGAPADYVERHALRGQAAMSQVASLVLSGAFVRHPKLTVVFAGSGFSWLPHLLWRMEQAWRVLPEDTRGSLRESPTETVRDHIRFVTGTEETDGDPEEFASVFDLSEGGRLLMYGSGYPYGLEGEKLAGFSALGEAERRSFERERALEAFPRLGVVAR